MVRFLAAAVMVVAAMAPGTAWAGEHDPKPKNDDSTGCCFSFRDSPVLICVQPGSCQFTTPPPK